jgi:hypothetical protein
LSCSNRQPGDLHRGEQGSKAAEYLRGLAIAEPMKLAALAPRGL